MKIIIHIKKKAERKAVAHKYQISRCFSLFLKFYKEEILYEELVFF